MFIYIFNLGFSGAPLATSALRLVQFSALVVMNVYSIKKLNVNISLKDFKEIFHYSGILQFLKFGVPGLWCTAKRF